MKKDDTFISKSTPFLPLFIVLWMVGLWMTLSVEKGSLHLALSSCHTPFWDRFFLFYTELGGHYLPYLIPLLLLYSYRLFGAATLSQAVALIAIYPIKRIFSMPRPLIWFEQQGMSDLLYRVEGLKLHSSNSFPSGHTFAAFALLFLLCLYTSNRWLKLLYLVLAVGVGYSRIYLSQHFLADVVAGSLIGVLAATLCYYTSIKWSAPWLDNSIFRIFKRPQQ